MPGEREFPPHLIDVRDRMLTTLEEGGITAVEQLVDALSVEEATAQTFASGARQIEEEVAARRNALSGDEVANAVALALHTTHDHELALKRQNFAQGMLGVFREFVSDDPLDD